MNHISRIISCTLLASIAIQIAVLRAQDHTDSIESRLERVLKNMVERPNVINCAAIVDFGDRSWTDAEGLADPTAATPMTPEHQFRTASVAKTFTAVLIQQLVEEGRLSLDDHIGKLLAPQLDALKRPVDDLQITRGSKHGHRVTVKHLLTHTSGIPDYFFEKSTAGAQQGRSFLDVAFTDIGGTESREMIDRRWEPIDLLRYFFDNELSVHAKFEPGTGFHYSDTNYLLLGLIIENATGRSLANNVRTRILEPLDMRHTYYEWREPARGGQLAHHFIVVDGKNYDFVKDNLYGSAEWANGGMVTTAADLNRFVRGLFANKLFKRAKTLESLLNVTNGATFDKPHAYFDKGDFTFNAYTFGLARWTILDRHECWGHTGFFGIGMFYFPERGVSIVFANSQVDASVADDLNAIAKVLSDGGFLGGDNVGGTER